MPVSKPPYLPEFKAEAVRLYQQSGKSLQEIASDLGVSTNSLREWVRRAKGDHSPDGNRANLNQDEREELRRLQRENRISREEREILKKAAAKSPQQGVPCRYRRASVER